MWQVILLSSYRGVETLPVLNARCQVIPSRSSLSNRVGMVFVKTQILYVA